MIRRSKSCSKKILEGWLSRMQTKRLLQKFLKCSMADLNNIKAVYLIGIGGIGMSALARYFKRQGKLVNGYDKTETDLTRQLVQEGIGVRYEDSVETIPKKVELVIYTPAIPKDQPGL